MDRPLPRWIVAFCLCFPALGQAGVEDLQQSLDLVKSKISTLEQRLEREQSDMDETLSTIRRLDKALAENLTQQATVREDIDHTQLEIDRLESDFAQLSTQKAQHQARLAEQLRQLAMEQRQGPLKQLLSRSDWREARDIMRLYPYLHTARQAQIEDTLQLIDEVETLLTHLEAEKKVLEALLSQRETLESNLHDEKRARQAAIDALQARMASTQDALRVEQEREAHLERVLLEINQRLMDIPSASEWQDSLTSLRGKLPWPVRGMKAPKDDKTTALFKALKAGTPIYPVYPGRVVFANWLKGMGFLIIVDHGDGYLSLYGHNERLHHVLGDWVTPTDPIATVGQSGGRAEPGLYFELRHQGRPLPLTEWMQRTT